MKTLNFLLTYKKYLLTIENTSLIEDRNIYDNFENQYLTEGLITTHPTEKSLSIIKRKFQELDGEIEPDGEIFLQGYFNELGKYLPLFNNLGYFISKLTLDGENWIKTYSNDTKPIALFLEAKYDVKIEPLPTVLYHATLSKNVKNISINGLIPKSLSKLSNHPDRIYLTDNLNIAEDFANYLKNEYKQDYVIYKIISSDLNIDLYKDINLTGGGYYTLNNISKDAISICKTFYLKK